MNVTNIKHKKGGHSHSHSHRINFLVLCVLMNKFTLKNIISKSITQLLFWFHSSIFSIFLNLDLALKISSSLRHAYTHRPTTRAMDSNTVRISLTHTRESLQRLTPNPIHGHLSSANNNNNNNSVHLHTYAGVNGEPNSYIKKTTSFFRLYLLTSVLISLLLSLYID